MVQVGAGGLRRLDDLARFLEENLAHLLVVLVLADQRDRRHRLERRRRAHRREPGRLGRGRDEVDERLRELAARGRQRPGVFALADRLLRLQHRRRERRLVGGLRLVREAFEVARDLFDRHVLAHRREGEHLRLLDQARLDRRRADRRVRRRAASHHRRERARLGVVDEERLGHLRLDAQHVDHEAERREVAGEAFEDAGRLHLVGIDLGRDHAVDLAAHAQQRLRRRVHAEHESTPRIEPSWTGTSTSARGRRGSGRTCRSPSRPRRATRAAPGRRCPSSAGRRRAGRAPPSTARAARAAASGAPARAARRGA